MPSSLPFWIGGIVLIFAASLAKSRLRSRQAHATVEGGGLLVDVRTPAEFASGHLDGALNLPYDRLYQRPVELPQVSRPLVVYCRSGSRSAVAARRLRALGYEKIVDLGPMSAW